MRTISCLILLLLAAPCVADVVTTNTGQKFVGTFSMEGDIAVVESRVEGLVVRRKIAKSDIASVVSDDATKAQAPTAEEASARKAKIKREGEEVDAKAQQEKKAEETAKAALADKLNAVRAAETDAQRKRADAVTRINSLCAQADFEIAGAYRDYNIEISVPHPNNQDLFRAAALETRDNKVANIRAAYGSKVAEAQAVVAQCDRDLTQFSDTELRLLKQQRDM